MRRPRLATLLLVVLATACGSSADSEPRTITVGGERVAVATLVDAQAGLCEAEESAATDPLAARAAFFDRSHDALHTVARALQDVDRAQAGGLLEAKEKVESGLDSRPPTLAADVARLADVYHDALGRLAISAPPCEK